MGVLDGVKVVESAQQGFVPSCGAVLGDSGGEEVIKIERPTGDPLRAIMGAGFIADTGDYNFLWELYNRNKRGIVLDLRVSEGSRGVRPSHRTRRRIHHQLPPVGAHKLRTNPEDLFGGEPRLIYAPRVTARVSEGPTPTPAVRRGVVLARGGIGHILSPAPTAR